MSTDEATAGGRALVRGTLVGTLLGNAISVQVRAWDFVAVGLTIVLAGVSVADVLYLNLRERSAELATLRAVGWSDAHIRSTVVLGAGFLGVSISSLIVAASLIPLSQVARLTRALLATE